MTRQLNYNRIPQTSAKHRAFHTVAKRQGHEYAVFIEKWVHPSKPEEGCRFVQPNDEDAIETAHLFAKMLGNGDSDAQYPLSAYKLYHVNTGRLMRAYTPPEVEEPETEKAKRVV